MKLLLIKDVKKIGQKGQIVEVSEGYGTNFLIKRGLGRLAVGGVLKDAKNKKNLKKNAQLTQVERLEKAFFDAKGKEFEMEANANEKGHLFVGIHKKDIANLLGLEEKNIELKRDIKEIGDHLLEIKHGKHKAKVKIAVKSQ